jgi:hypothetical protein
VLTNNVPNSFNTSITRQLGHVGRNPARLILAEQLGCRASPRLILEIDIGKLLPVAVADNEAGVQFLDLSRREPKADSPGQREAAATKQLNVGVRP